MAIMTSVFSPPVEIKSAMEVFFFAGVRRAETGRGSEHCQQNRESQKNLSRRRAKAVLSQGTHKSLEKRKNGKVCRHNLPGSNEFTNIDR